MESVENYLGTTLRTLFGLRRDRGFVLRRKPSAWRRVILVMATVGMTIAACGVLTGQETKGSAPITTGLRVVTCGNSFHAWFVAPIIADLANGAGITGHQVLAESKIGGSPAINHWLVPDAMNKAKAALTAGTADAMTLACMHRPDAGIDRFAELGVAHRPDFRISLQEFWMPYDSVDWPYRGNEQLIDPDSATVVSLTSLHAPYFAAMDAYVSQLNKRLGKSVVAVAPVGQAVLLLRGAIIAKKIAGITTQSELFTDKLLHPKPSLQTLVAYVHFAVLYRRSPIGLPAPRVLRDANLDPKLNGQLQEIAWEAVTTHPLSGVTRK